MLLTYIYDHVYFPTQVSETKKVSFQNIYDQIGSICLRNVESYSSVIG